MAPTIRYFAIITAALFILLALSACVGDLKRTSTSRHPAELSGVPPEELDPRTGRVSDTRWTVPDKSVTESYPRSEFLTAWGVSNEGVRQAELDARALIAEKIKSDIKSITTLETSLVTTNGESEEHERYVSTVDVRAGFSHAEMIRIDPAYSTRVDDHYWAFAYLQRDSVTLVLGQEYENRATGFREIARLVDSTDVDLTRYTAVFRLAETSFEVLTAKASEIHAVSGRSFDAYVGDLEIFRRLEAKRSIRVATTTIGVEVTAVGEMRQGILTTLFTNALSDMGVRVSGGGCGLGDYVLRVTPIVDWELGLVGEMCRVTFGVELASCRTDRVIALTEINDPRLSVWNIKDENQALRIILDRVTSIDLTERLRECLHPSLPFS